MNSKIVVFFFISCFALSVVNGKMMKKRQAVAAGSRCAAELQAIIDFKEELQKQPDSSKLTGCLRALANIIEVQANNPNALKQFFDHAFQDEFAQLCAGSGNSGGEKARGLLKALEQCFSQTQ